MVERRQRQASRARAYGLLALALVSDAGWIARASAQAPANAAPFQNAAPYQTAYNDLGLSAPFTGSAPAPTRPAFRMSAVDWRPKAAPIERTPSTAPAPAVRIDGEPIPAGSASAPTAAAARTSSSGPIAAAPPAAAGLPLGAGVAAGAATAGVVPVAGHAPNAGPTPNGNAAPTPAPAPSYAGSPNAPAAPVPPREGRTIITSEGRIPASAAPTAAAPNGPTPADPSGLPPRMASLPANSAPSDYPAPASANAPGSIAPASYEPSGEQPGVVRRIGNPTPADPNFSGWNAAQPAPTYDVARRQDGPAPPADAPAGGPSDAPLITGGEGIVPPPAPMSTDDDKGYWHLGQQHLDPRCKNPNLLAPEERMWYTRGDYLYWQREGGSPQNIAFSDDTNQVVLDAGTLNFDFQQGVRLTIGKILKPDDPHETPCSSMEFTMFNILRQTENERVTSDTDDIVSYFSVGAGPGFVVDAFDFASKQTIEYSSDLWNFESNYLRDVDAPFNLRSHFLLGMRSMTLFENFDYHSTDVLLGATGDYKIKSQSNIFGPQVGGAVEYPLGDGWWLTLRGKTGLMVNQSHQESRIYSGNDEVQFNEGNKWTMTGMVDLGLLTRIELSDRAEIHMGYEAMFLSGVALASEQLDFSTSFGSQRSVDVQSSLYYHGITAGSTIRW